MCLISPLLACQETRKNRKKEGRRPNCLCRRYHTFVVQVLSHVLWKSTTLTSLSHIGGRPFPECARVSFDQVLPSRVGARRRMAVSLAATHSRTQHLSLSLSLMYISPFMRPTYVYPFFHAPGVTPQTTMSFSHTSFGSSR